MQVFKLFLINSIKIIWRCDGIIFWCRFWERLTISEQSISTLLQLVSANTKLEVLTFLIEIPLRVFKSRLLKNFKSFLVTSASRRFALIF